MDASCFGEAFCVQHQERRESNQDSTRSYQPVRAVFVFYHLSLINPFRNTVPTNSPLSMQINETLNIQTQRMEEAAREEKRRKAASIDGRKRAASTPAEQPSDAKRPKLEPETSNTPNLASTLAAFDFTSLPPSLITDLIIANLEVFTESALETLVQQHRQKRGLGSVPAVSAAYPAVPVAALSSILPSNVPTGPRKLVAQHATEGGATPPPRSTPPIVKVEEPVDPLQMDIDQDELEFEPETLNAKVRIPRNHTLCILMCLFDSSQAVNLPSRRNSLLPSLNLTDCRPLNSNSLHLKNC